MAATHIKNCVSLYCGPIQILHFVQTMEGSTQGKMVKSCNVYHEGKMSTERFIIKPLL